MADHNLILVHNFPSPSLPDESNRILERVITYLHRQSGEVRTCEEYEDNYVALKLLALLREGWTSRPGLFDAACGYALGLPPSKLPFRRAARAAHLRQQFMRLIPDYDYSQDKLPDFDPTDGRRHHYYGNRYRHLAAQKSTKRVTSPAQARQLRDTNSRWEYFGA